MEVKPIFGLDENIDQTEYYWFEKGFTEEELEWVANLSELYAFEAASIVGSTSEVQETRKSKIKWIHHDENSIWLYDKLGNFAVEANSNIWKFDLRSVVDSIQYTEYLANGSHYDWHVDIGPAPINHRKISIVTQLSDSSDYEGGDFQLWTGGKFVTLPRTKGCTMLFPSFLLHRVTPVTKGIRKSLVLWIGGGSLK